MQNTSIPPAHVHNIGYAVDSTFLLYPISLNTGKINLTSLQSAVIVNLSGNIERAVSDYAGGHGFDWSNLEQYSAKTARDVLNKKNDAILSLLVYNSRLDIDLDVSEMYLLIKKHNRIILTTESLMESDIGFVTHVINKAHTFPVDQPQLVCKTDLTNDHAEFYILVHHLVETDAQGLEIQHTLATFEPLEYHAHFTTQSFQFLCAHEKRNEGKTDFDSQLHYDFFLQDWDVVKGVSSLGILPNGNALTYKHADLY